MSAAEKALEKTTPTLVYVGVGLLVYWLLKDQIEKLLNQLFGREQSKPTETQFTDPGGDTVKIEARVIKPSGTVDVPGRAETDFMASGYTAEVEITNFGPTRKAVVSFESQEQPSWRAFSEGVTTASMVMDLPQGKRVIQAFEMKIAAASVRLGRIDAIGVLKIDGREVARSYYAV